MRNYPTPIIRQASVAFIVGRQAQATDALNHPPATASYATKTPRAPTLAMEVVKFIAVTSLVALFSVMLLAFETFP